MAGGGDVEIERSLSFSLVQALTLPLARRVETTRYEQARLTVGAAIEHHAYETRRAWIEAVAARQALDCARRVNAAAEASAELMGRMARSGNAATLDRAREQAFHAEAGAALMRAEQQRFDVAAARQDAAALAASLGLTRTTRFVNVLDLGIEHKRETGMPAARGHEIAIELPLFDWGQARNARAEALYMQSLRRVADTAIDARSGARERYLGYRTARDLARHYRDEVLPLRKQISSEILLRYNGMLASPFDLLLDAREQAAAVNATIESLKDFWSAHVALEEAPGGPVAHTVPAPPHHKEHAE